MKTIGIESVLGSCASSANPTKTWERFQDSLKKNKATTGDSVLDFAARATSHEDCKRMGNLLLTLMERLRSMRGKPAMLVYVSEIRTPTGRGGVVASPDEVQVWYTITCGIVETPRLVFKEQA